MTNLNYRSFAPVRNPSLIKKDIEEHGIKAILLDAKMKNLPPKEQIKVFRLFKAKIRRINPSNPNERVFYDLHFHYIPKQGELVKEEMLYPVLKVGSEAHSVTSVGLDEFETQQLMQELLYSLLNDPRRETYQTIDTCTICHKGNFKGDNENPFIYEIDKKQELYVKDAFKRLIRSSGMKGNQLPFNLDIGTALAFKIKVSKELKGQSKSRFESIDSNVF